MEDRGLTIQAFYERLMTEEEGGDESLFAILRQLTGIVDKEQLKADTPSPLGAWAGWSS